MDDKSEDENDYFKEDGLMGDKSYALKSGLFKQPKYNKNQLVARSIIGTSKVFDEGKEIKK